MERRLTSGQRILRAWLLIASVAAIGWVAGAVYADRYVAGLDREEVCANTGVALGDTVLRRVERARSDSIALADRNCAARYRLARQGRAVMVRIPLVIAVLLSALVAGLFSIIWGSKRVRASRLLG
jgi:hypothetical protein